MPKVEKPIPNHEEEEKNDVFEFLNLTELFNEWDNEDQRVCSDEEMND